MKAEFRSCLTVTPTPAKDILKLYRVHFPEATKSDVNKVLYALLKDESIVKTNDTPPLWSLPLPKQKATQVVDLSDPIIHIYVLNNFSFSKFTEPYENANVKLHIYFDRDVEGSMPKFDRDVDVWQARDELRLGLQLKVVWSIATERAKLGEKRDMLVLLHDVFATRKIAETAESVERLRVEFFKNWDELRIHLE